MKSKLLQSHLAPLTLGLALVSLTPQSWAQLGNGWIEYKPARKIHLVDHDYPVPKGMRIFDWTNRVEVGSPTPCADYSYDEKTDTETFRLFDKRSNRAEIRLHNDYGVGSRQFEGYVTFFAPLNDESLMQIWGSDEGATQLMMRGYAANGGEIGIANAIIHGNPRVATNCYGREIKVNIIHLQEDVGNKFIVYLDDKKVLEFPDGEHPKNNNGKNYHKYGCYGTLRTAGAVVKWRKVRHFQDGTAPAEPPTATVVVPAAKSEWAFVTPEGKLGYKTLPAGDRFMDFSFAGYMGGGVALPSVPVKATVAPSGGDDSEAIQAALDSVAKLELVSGFRGAVLLKPGTYRCSKPLVLSASGVVLCGSGSGAGGTTLTMTEAPHLCISVGSRGRLERVGIPARVTDAYVPSGTSVLHVDDAASFKVGDAVLVCRPVTAAWVKFMGMDTLVRSGRKETWLSTSGETTTERVIRKLEGNQVTLDIPLSDSLDAKYLNPAGASLVHCADGGRISQVGVEHLRIVAPPQVVEISEKHHQAVRLNGVCDAWVKDLAIEDTVNSVGIGSNARRVTVENVSIRHGVATKGAAKPADFSADGSQVLFNRCTGTGDNLFYFVTGARVTGPIVLLNCVFHGNGHIQPHARWATGLLVDGCQVPESGIDLMNRGEMGSGHGWTLGWGVVWNCTAKSYIIQQPPGAANWAIGCIGRQEASGMPFGHQPNLPGGIFDSHGTPVAPASLYLAQLQERLGPQALKNIGY